MGLYLWFRGMVRLFVSSRLAQTRGGNTEKALYSASTGPRTRQGVDWKRSKHRSPETDHGPSETPAFVGRDLTSTKPAALEGRLTRPKRRMMSSTATSAGHTPYTRDRTKEFQSLIALAKQRRPSPDAAGPGGERDAAVHLRTRPAGQRRAAAVGVLEARIRDRNLGIHSTSQKLQKLTQLAKRTSMFDDPAQEIHDLSSIVKHDIQALNQGITDLQTFLGGVGNKQSARHSSTVVETLRNRLKDATKEFKNVLELRTDNLKVHAERKSLFDSSGGSSSSLQRMGMPPGLQPGASFLPRRGGSAVGWAA